MPDSSDETCEGTPKRSPWDFLPRSQEEIYQQEQRMIAEGTMRVGKDTLAYAIAQAMREHDAREGPKAMADCIRNILTNPGYVGRPDVQARELARLGLNPADYL